jgi:Mrp family chromosome partitioning ATPase
VFEPSTSESQLDSAKAHWFEYNAERRGGFMIPKGEGTSKVYILSEPSPDAASTATLKLAAKAAEQGEIDTEFAKDVVQLGQRTQAVMLLREAMYRLSEMNQNTALTEAQVSALYDKVLNAASQIALAEIKQAETKKEEAKARQDEAAAHELDLQMEAIKLFPENQEKPLETMNLRARARLEASREVEGNK